VTAQVKESDIVKFEAGSFDKACISADVGHHQLSRKLQVRIPAASSACRRRSEKDGRWQRGTARAPIRTWTGRACTETGNQGRGPA
jgi:hypothetical protein